MSEKTCPSCGAPAVVRNPATISKVCEFCSTVMIWDQDSLKNAGKESRLAEGYSRLYRWATGSIQGTRFQVLGRVRYSFGRGFWDEWYVMLENGEGHWITEDNHEFSFQELSTSVSNMPAFDQVSVGDNLTINDRDYQIQEKGMATCLGMEGELPRGILPNEQYPYVDGSSYDGEYTFGLEYDNDNGQPTLFVGKWVRPNQLKLDDESLDW